ncbi:MAG: hypothetical protein K1X88_10795 [Nannocystaceae bacterium]|nr:hypothetical protein [Nannocystaceae bacterium]
MAPRINVKRVLLGGLVAALVINLSAITMVPAVGDQMDQALGRVGLPPLPAWSYAYFMLVSSSLGMVLVWLYAAVLPRFGPGPRTAIVVALVLWLVAYFFANVAMVVYGFMPVRLTVIGTVWGLGELVLASLVGTRLYRDA